MITLFVAHAFAWERNDADWSGQTAPIDEPFLLNAGSFADAELAPDDVELAYQRALDVWNVESGADLFLEYGGRSTSTTRGGGDNDENVAFYGDFTISAGIAITTWGYVDDAINDCDTEFHSGNLYGGLDWYVTNGDDTAPSYTFDLVHTMIHETGHCLGLGHSADDDAIMRTYNSDGTGEESRHLHPDDIAGIQAIYGAVAPELSVLDADLGDTPVEGDIVRIDLPIQNVGDGTAWHVTGAIDGGSTVEIGTIASDTPVGNRIGASTFALSFPWEVTCDGGFDLALADARGNTWDAFVPVECVPAGDGNPEAPGGCGCATGTSSAVWFAPLLAALALRARRRA